MSERLPPLKLLAAFDAVSRGRGFRAAAEELNVTQPAISQSIRKLEDHLGAALFDRATRPLALTAAGIALQAACDEAFGRLREAAAEIRELGKGGGAVTVACSVGVATYWLMPRLAGFYERQPGIAVNVLTTPQGAPPLRRGMDMAIRYGRGDWGGGEGEKLFDETVRPVCHPDLAGRIAAGRQAFEAVTLLHVEAEDDSWLTWSGYQKRAGLPALRNPGRHFTNYVQSTQAALQAQGVMLGWKSITGDLENEGRLVALAMPQVDPGRGFYLVQAPSSRDKPAVGLLAGHLADNTA
ncbi:LysR substrate-binding domain-containing protein [Zhengella mangrovi]|uniref:LysR substrate-binding domain-containing protein n=1 Tax=Zhengella mangrovi TaxID=1982044 RepID=UPI0013FD483E|nr:LysR substrate-binding domain-containing protein [Zhengella mangrovi]